jgi:hypothetical protein
MIIARLLRISDRTIHWENQRYDMTYVKYPHNGNDRKLPIRQLIERKKPQKYLVFA